MPYVKKYFNKPRFVVLAMCFIGFSTYAVLHYFWADICVSYECSSYVMSGFLAPLREAGLVLTAVTLPFLFLPTHYFKTWLLWIFLPATAFTLLALANLDPNSSNMFRTTREVAMANFMYWWLPLTLLFVAVHYHRTRQYKSLTR